MPCSHCGAALAEHVAVCPQCGAKVLLEVLPAAERVPPPALLPARILTPDPRAIAQARTVLAARRRARPADLNGARRWGMSRSAAILLFGFAIAFGTYVSITERDVALVKWQKVLFHNEPGPLPAGIGNNLPAPPSPVPLVALMEREIAKSRAEDAKDAQIVRNDEAKASEAQAAAKKSQAVPAPVAAAHPPKAKAAAVASAAPSREQRVSEPRKAETAPPKTVTATVAKAVQKPVEKPAVVAVEKPPVVTTEKPASAALEKTAETAPMPTPTPTPRAPRQANAANGQRGDAIQRAAQACNKENSTGCIHRQLAKTESIDRVEKSDQSGVAEAVNAEPKTAPRERLTREPVRTAAASAITAAPVEVVRKAPPPDAAPVAMREASGSAVVEPAPPKSAPSVAQRFAVSEEINRLYRGH
ncbi:zinc ribbon domain-containing protein [Trinickia terrae]|uniref:Zinc ribbon domain-containing protein n=1 Tax=Trinickia terrae TaxID=2571161 RepID=A0A4U1I725_9BURK|nr:zinc ribbon domain-containing protein [Trinickia terrae]TKC89201.1 zinc ribbon domain-containing protein [Trinickia terrae]